ncbi:MAG: hypothetical protein PUC37_04750 [Spirochaetales bacterium]|nr:hypothetical protein [Treponema sp.]MDD5929098.1 hypothetical protein [Spirochaetales bacterium]
MKTRKLFFIISFLFVFGQIAVFSQNSEEDSSAVKNDFTNASVSIKYYNRTIYYPENSEDNPILVHVTIKNNGSETLRFKLADDRMFSMDFNALTVKNKSLPLTENIKEKRTTNQVVYFREISIEQGEEYSFVENVKDFINIEEPSVYYLEASFYPELYKSKYISLKSNRLTLEIRPSPSSSASNYVPVKYQTVEILEPEAISPDKVIEQTIIARQKSLWDQYFLYLDVESLLLRTPSLKKKYNTVSASERERMIEAFKVDLMQAKIENDIIAIPQSFEIEKTTYSPTEGSVSVIEWFKYTNYTEKKRYVYKIRQREGVWRIYDYTVVNLGTE